MQSELLVVDFTTPTVRIACYAPGKTDFAEIPRQLSSKDPVLEELPVQATRTLSQTVTLVRLGLLQHPVLFRHLLLRILRKFGGFNEVVNTRGKSQEPVFPDLNVICLTHPSLFDYVYVNSSSLGMLWSLENIFLKAKSESAARPPDFYSAATFAVTPGNSLGCNSLFVTSPHLVYSYSLYYAMRQETFAALILDIGADVCTACVVCGDVLLNACTRRSIIGGFDVSSLFLRAIRARIAQATAAAAAAAPAPAAGAAAGGAADVDPCQSFLTEVPRMTFEHVRVCPCAGGPSTLPQDLICDPRTGVPIGHERVACAEVLMDPSAFSNLAAGLPALVLDALSAAPPALVPALLANIFVTGPFGALKGLTERLKNELIAGLPSFASDAVHVQQVSEVLEPTNLTQFEPRPALTCVLPLFNSSAYNEGRVTQELYSMFGVLCRLRFWM